MVLETTGGFEHCADKGDLHFPRWPHGSIDGIFSVIPIALFISEAVRATGSLLLSFAGGDTAGLMELATVGHLFEEMMATYHPLGIAGKVAGLFSNSR